MGIYHSYWHLMRLFDFVVIQILRVTIKGIHVLDYAMNVSLNAQLSNEMLLAYLLSGI